ncbi:ricin-type beta-trefoil lectin domain protein [Streptomyces sp. NPDC013161]|uniref:RICIN domain-containing protein n=1 Tax=Streptomyces sp. NPDC013161 TaxID=3364862 RepID=UPI0036CB4E1E
MQLIHNSDCKSGRGSILPLAQSKRGRQEVRRSLKQLTVLCALAAVAAISFTSPASAADGTARYQNSRSSACLDSNGAGSVYTQGCNTGNYQYWKYQNIAGTTLYYLINKATSRCLDTNSANSVYTLSCNGGRNQRWERIVATGSTGLWKNLATGKCLTGNVEGTVSHAVFTEGCVVSDQPQRWVRLTS